MGGGVRVSIAALTFRVMHVIIQNVMETMGRLPDCCIDYGLSDNCDNKDCNSYGDRAYFFNQ